MSADRTHNILVYRNNATWRALAEELKEIASRCAWQEELRADDLIIHIFPEGTSETDIEQWMAEQRDALGSALWVYADGTTARQIANMKVKKDHKVVCLDRAYSLAAARVFNNSSSKTSLTEMYRGVFALVVESAGITHVEIVLDHLADYNPLMIQGFDEARRYDQDELKRYAEAFKDLMPETIDVRFIRISDLTPPGEYTLVLCHHHARNSLEANKEESVKKNPRVLMPYPNGFLEKAAGLCDISSVVKDDILDALREALKRL